MRNVRSDKFFVYIHINKINKKVYIGITSYINPKDRWGSNGINYKQNRHFYSAIKKYGWNNFEHNILFSNLTKQEACEREKELIAQYNSNNEDFGYNGSIGGELSALGCKRIQTEETIAKIKANHSSKKSIICLDTLKIFDSIHDCANIMGLDYRYISRVLTGKAKSCHGYHFCYLEDYNSNKEYKLYKRNKMIICTETGEVFNSITECAKRMNLNKGNICDVLKGRRKTFHGLHFEYYIGEK